MTKLWYENETIIKFLFDILLDCVMYTLKLLQMLVKKANPSSSLDQLSLWYFRGIYFKNLPPPE